MPGSSSGCATARRCSAPEDRQGSAAADSDLDSDAEPLIYRFYSTTPIKTRLRIYAKAKH